MGQSPASIHGDINVNAPVDGKIVIIGHDAKIVFQVIAAGVQDGTIRADLHDQLMKLPQEIIVRGGAQARQLTQAGLKPEIAPFSLRAEQLSPRDPFAPAIGLSPAPAGDVERLRQDFAGIDQVLRQLDQRLGGPVQEITSNTGQVRVVDLLLQQGNLALWRFRQGAARLFARDASAYYLAQPQDPSAPALQAFQALARASRDVLRGWVLLQKYQRQRPQLIGPDVVQQLSQGRWHEVLQGWVTQGQINAETLQYEYDYLKAIGHSYHPEQVRAAAQEAEDCFVQALRRQPGNTAALVSLAAIKTESALIFYLETGTPDRVRLQEARSLFEQAHALLERRPDQQGRIALAACLLYEATSLPPQAVLESVKWAARQRRQLQQEGRDAQAGVQWEVVQRNLARRDPQFVDWQKIKRASQLLAGAGATALLFFAEEALALRPEILKLVNAGCMSRRAFLVGGASATAAVVLTAGGVAAATGHLPSIFGGPTPTTTNTPTATNMTTATNTPAVTNTPQSSLTPGTTTQTYAQQSGAITGVGWQPGSRLALAAPRSGSGPLIASASVDGTVAVWDAISGTPVTHFTGHRLAVRALAWSRNGSSIASCGGDGLRVWNAFSGTVQGSFSHFDFPINAVAWSPDGQRLAINLAGNVQLVDSAGNPLGTLKSFGLATIYTLAWSPDGQKIAAGGALHVSTLAAGSGLGPASSAQPGPVDVWDVSSGNLLAIYTGQTTTVRGLSWSPDSQLLASGSDDRTVQVWRVSDGSQMLSYTGHKDVINGVSWQPSGNMVASASADGTVQVWDASSGKNLLTYRAHTSPVYSVAWSPGSTRIASGGDQGQVRIWVSPAVR